MYLRVACYHFKCFVASFRSIVLNSAYFLQFSSFKDWMSLNAIMDLSCIFVWQLVVGIFYINSN